MAIRELTEREKELLVGGIATRDWEVMYVTADYFHYDFGYSFELSNDPFDWAYYHDYSDGSGNDGGGGGSYQCEATHAADMEPYVDASASKLAREIIAKPNSSNAEYLGLIYRDGHGVIQSTTLYGGTGGSVTVDFETLGFPASQVIAMVHNHDKGHYGQTSAEVNLNRYLSVNDWATADQIIAAGADSSSFAMYLLDTNNNLRQYDYGDKSTWVNNNGSLKNNATLGTTTSKTLTPSYCP